MKLRVVGDDLQPLFMGTLLFNMRAQLSSMRCLSLGCAQSWVGAAAAWRELAKLTGLTKLHCTWSKQVGCALTGAVQVVDHPAWHKKLCETQLLQHQI